VGEFSFLWPEKDIIQFWGENGEICFFLSTVNIVVNINLP
jgi:hypothetical protein